MEEIIKNYNTVLEQIRISADEADRNMDEIKLIIVTKKFDVESIKPLLDIGHLYYGENRVQEAKDKWPNLMNEYKNIELNLIGPLQTNKTKIALDLFSSIHTIDRKKLVDKILEYPEKIKKNNLKNLSMGMSSDFKEAILFGATHIRIGEAIMGDRIG